LSRLRDDHRRLIEAVREAGPLALHYFHGEVESWHKGPDDPVSEADHAIDALLHERLTAARPDYGWLSEETEDDLIRLQRQRVWVVDPIDGTRAFLRDEPQFTICAGLVDDGRPVAAAVFNPATDELFDAVRGGGARLNGKTIAVSERDRFDGAQLLAGRRMFERAGTTMPPDLRFATVNSIAYRMCLVACGRYDGCVSLNGKSDWDLAAAELVVSEAGGLVTDSHGEGFVYNRRHTRHRSLVTAGPAMHARLMAMIAQIKRPAGAHW